MTASPDLSSLVDLSDLPADMNPALRDEIAAARLKRIETEHRKLEAETELRRQRSLGVRYKAWALDDTIGRDLQAAFTPRGAA